MVVDVIPSSEWNKVNKNLAEAKYRNVMNEQINQPEDFYFGYSYAIFTENMEKLRRQCEYSLCFMQIKLS